VALKLAVVEPAETMTEAGTVSAGLFDSNPTEEPPVGAVFDKVIVQAVALPELTVVGAHCSVETREAVVIEKAILPDVPPPGVGLNTVTCAVPAAAMSAAAIAASNCVALT